jgi:hypothetical protein
VDVQYKCTTGDQIGPTMSSSDILSRKFSLGLKRRVWELDRNILSSVMLLLIVPVDLLISVCFYIYSTIIAERKTGEVWDWHYGFFNFLSWKMSQRRHRFMSTIILYQHSLLLSLNHITFLLPKYSITGLPVMIRVQSD